MVSIDHLEVFKKTLLPKLQKELPADKYEKVVEALNLEVFEQVINQGPRSSKICFLRNSCLFF